MNHYKTAKICAIVIWFLGATPGTYYLQSWIGSINSAVLQMILGLTAAAVIFGTAFVLPLAVYRIFAALNLFPSTHQGGTPKPIRCLESVEKKAEREFAIVHGLDGEPRRIRSAEEKKLHDSGAYGKVVSDQLLAEC